MRGWLRLAPHALSLTSSTKDTRLHDPWHGSRERAYQPRWRRTIAFVPNPRDDVTREGYWDRFTRPGQMGGIALLQ